MELSLEKVVRLVRKNLIFVLAVTILFTAGALGFSAFVLDPVYTCQVKFSLKVEDATILDFTRLQNLVYDVVERIKSDAFYEMASQASGGKYTPRQIECSMTFSAVDEATVFTAKVNGATPQEAYDLACLLEKVAPVFFDNRGEVYAIDPLIYAKLPTAPSSPNVVTNTVLGFVMGALLSCCIVVAVHYFDRRIRSEQDVVEAFSLPVLGIVPDFDTGSRKENA